jgi:uncharacterized cupin superfamily protein
MNKVVITAFDINAARKAGETSLVVPGGALVTPQAADDARGYGIALLRAGQDTTAREPDQAAVQTPSRAAGPAGQAAPSAMDEVRRRVMTKLGNRAPASLDAVIDAVLAACPVAGAGNALAAPFIKKAGTVTRVSASALPQPDNAAATPAAVSMVEAVPPSDAHPGLGYMSWENSSFDWTFRYAEVLVVLGGEITLSASGAILEGKPGDAFVIPAQSAVTLSAKDRARCVHASWPNPETAKG